ncbi:cohesin domain-containing protein [Methanosarcina mazei]|uniref:Cohesin domain-containing protein n=1 Tax=Methanosarcina mazei TaxID=2209 RepID=A0A0F8IIM7_METMZ|nr:cohesin domain-containing protein [Methanosarcina mazei]KKG67695.1 hypothetical protein DU46_14935 [Methanosarcina mazei]KKG79264.1 hypothetical protein DU61_01145 [Methanosarcina mazei]KKH07696.1 hypothetical protein DU62_14270 [Methanosarcina mazei]KKH09362.1 hypothetical protein DU51_15885 [Methanosarcina mazei]
MKKRSLQLIVPRFAFVLMLFALLATVVTGTVSSEAVIQISPQEPGTEGEDFTVEIYIEPDEPIAGVQLDFMFDSSLVSVKDVREGNLLKQPGSDTMFTPGAIEGSQGAVTGIYGFILGKNEATSPGTFASIDLTSAGTAEVCELQLSNIIVSDSSGHAVPVKVVNGTVRIENAPELSPEVSAGKIKPEEGLTGEGLTEKELSEEEMVEEELLEEDNEGGQENQNSQPASQSIFSDICDIFRDWFSV